MNYSEDSTKQLNDLTSFLKFKPTWIFKKFIYSRAKIKALFTGNQFGKTAGVAYSYVLRILGIHPIVELNIDYKECVCGEKWHFWAAPERCGCGGEVVVHERNSRTFRFCSETLPGQSGSVVVDGESAEVKNTQFPAFVKWLPACMIKQNITFRSPSMVIVSPYGCGDIVVEYVSYNQQVQATAGTQRLSVWYDEEPPKDFREEQIPRLLAENGDEVFSVTPASYITWMYDEIFEKARKFYRTKAICNFLKEIDGVDCKNVEKTGSEKDIEVFQAATDDNPTLKKEAIQALFDNLDDPDTLAIRRFGIFKQVSGRIYKDFSYGVHYISKKKWFPRGVPLEWVSGRGIDYHPQTAWAFGAIALSPQDEAFVFLESNPSPEKASTEAISEKIAELSGDRDFMLSLIDPLSEAHKRVDGGKSMTIRDDINNAFYRFKAMGKCRGGYWRTWDTKGEKGRDEVRKRLKNALRCKEPFNNKVQDENGKTVFLPTLWVLDCCPQSAKSMRQWRWEEFKDPKSLLVKEAKNTPEQRWSHFNMVWEALFKNKAFKAKSFDGAGPYGTAINQKKYFQGSS